MTDLYVRVSEMQNRRSGKDRFKALPFYTIGTRIEGKRAILFGGKVLLEGSDEWVDLERRLDRANPRYVSVDGKDGRAGIRDTKLGCTTWGDSPVWREAFLLFSLQESSRNPAGDEVARSKRLLSRPSRLSRERNRSHLHAQYGNYKRGKDEGDEVTPADQERHLRGLYDRLEHERFEPLRASAGVGDAGFDRKTHLHGLYKGKKPKVGGF